MNRKQYGFTPGVASLIMVLITLVMVVFSTLYLVQANANLKLSERNLENNLNYYDADSKAMSQYYAINEQLTKSDNIEESLEKLSSFGISYDSGIIKYEVDIDDRQYLLVELEIKYDEHYYAEIIKWQKKIDYKEEYGNQDFDF